MAEPGRVRLVGGGQRLGPGGADLGGGAVVDRCRGVEPDAAMAVDVVVVIEECRAERAASAIEPNRPGKAEQYLIVLNWASE